MIDSYRRVIPNMLKPILMTLLSHNKRLEFQYSNSHDIQLVSGNIVRHYGATSRKGWIGVVIGRSNSGTNRIDIVWLLDDQGKQISNGIDYAGIPQSYSQAWTVEGLRLCNNVTNIYQHETHLYPFNVKCKNPVVKEKILTEKQIAKVEEKIEPKEEFIIWSPSGTRNPVNVHNTLTVATKVAVDMAIKHNKEFFVCKLVVKTEPLKKARIIKL